MASRERTYRSVLGIALLLSGCASQTPSVDFTRSELRLIPAATLQKITSPHAAETTDTLIVDDRERTFQVRRFVEKEYAVATEEDGKETNIPFSQIAEIRVVSKPQPPVPKTKMTSGGAAEAVVETLSYAPIVPLAVATWPLLRAMGLDAQQNAQDTKRARLIYEGLSRNDLIHSIGPPKFRYRCTTDKGKGETEIWVYEEGRVLRGGRTLFIDVKEGTVYHNSFDTTFFLDSDGFECTPIESP